MLIHTVYISKLSIFLDLDWVKVFVLMCASASKYTILIVLALLYARFELFDVLFLFTGHRPTDAGLFGSLLCATSALGGFQSSRKARLICIIAGLLLFIIKPPLPWQGEVGFWYDQDHVPDREPDSDSMYSLGGRDDDEETYGSWFLILSIVFGLFGVGTMSGLCFGLFVMKESVIVCALCGAFVQYKSPNVFYAMVLAIMLTIISVTGGNEDVYNFLSVVAVCFLHCALSVKYTSYAVMRARQTMMRNRDDNKVYNPFVRKRQSANEKNFSFGNSGRNASSSSSISDHDMALNRVGNIATFLAYFATLVVFWDFEDSSFLTIPFVSTILFLSQTEKAAFLAYTAAVCGYLGQVLLCNSNEIINSAVFAGFSVPSVFIFARCLFSSFERQYKNSTLALSAPLNIVPIVMGFGVKSKAVVSLGIVGIASGSMQYVVQSRIQRRGSQYL
jgi:hypothetical protein